MYPNTRTLTIAGAGPGDPELLTLKAYKRIAVADVLLYDSLIADEILCMVSETAEMIEVGKRCGDGQDQTLRQDRINGMMVRYAREGKRCVRLKAGDPFVFGRGVEEVRALLEEGIDVEVIPGITAGIAAANLLHIPITERYRTTSVLFCTGHTAAYSREQLQAVMAMMKEGTPLVMYMGLKNLEAIQQRLLQGGMSAMLPVSVASNVSRPGQELVCGTLETIGDIIQQKGIETPAVFFIGEHALPVAVEISAGSVMNSFQATNNNHNAL